MTASDVEQWFDVENDDDVRDAVVADIVDEMEKIATETPVQEAEENEVEANEVTASPPSLAQLYAMFHPIQESAFYVTCPMRVVISVVQRPCWACTESPKLVTKETQERGRSRHS